MPVVAMTVNGKPVRGEVEARTLLVQFLRDHLRLTGTHVGCDTSQCGCCTVHVDDRAIKSCTALAIDPGTGGAVRVAVTGAGPYVFRLAQAEARPARSFTPEALDGLVVGQDNLNSDIHASAEYRAHVIVVMAKRAVAQAIG